MKSVYTHQPFTVLHCFASRLRQFQLNVGHSTVVFQSFVGGSWGGGRGSSQGVWLESLTSPCMQSRSDFRLRSLWCLIGLSSKTLWYRAPVVCLIHRFYIRGGGWGLPSPHIARTRPDTTFPPPHPQPPHPLGGPPTIITIPHTLGTADTSPPPGSQPTIWMLEPSSTAPV